MSIPIWQYVISMTSYIVFLILAIGFMRKKPKFALVLWVIMLFTFPLWNLEGWFRWVKTLSVMIPIVFLSLARFAYLDQRPGRFWEALRRPWVRWTFYGVWFLNIAEASIKDVTLGNYWNALAGFLLCVTIPFADKYWEFSRKEHGDLHAYTTGTYNFLYTSWNMCFVYAESPTFFFSTVCILLAAELYPIIKRRPELYVISRAYTLAIHLALRAIFPGLFPFLMNSQAFYNPQVLAYWGMLNGLLCIPFVFWHMWQLHTGKAENSFRRRSSPIHKEKGAEALSS
ncbi:hypothetical protein [Caldalkalibacillus mannanilyticus]|uniref:hypothetical protein n=1 Tax=Caldalkalibacillus mannanilyticus TaxID=1418 RepID=UPI00046AA24E|nr:hypothetical protein [Caldalkalibacillus mannanilyticus]